VFVVGRPPIGYKTISVIFNADSSILATINDKGVMLWDAQTGTLLARLDEARYPVAFSRDGHTLVTGGRNDTALRWQVEPQLYSLGPRASRPHTCVTRHG
jgi:WD40 repeat protein